MTKPNSSASPPKQGSKEEMNTKILLGLGLASILVSNSALAQTRAAARPAAAPASAIAQGPPIAGLCVLSQRGAIGGSTVGRYVSDRLQQIANQVRAEVGPEQTAIDADAKALQAQRATLDAATYQSRAGALQARAGAWQQKVDLRQREVQATERKALGRVAQELSPIVQQLYQQRRCSILLDGDVVLGVNPQMDLTQQATAQLNARITQFPFDREHLDTGAAAPAR